MAVLSASIGRMWDAAVAVNETMRAPQGPVAVPQGPFTPDDPLTMKMALELIGHEAIILEAYKDSVGVWTWGIGVTSASGHRVKRYIDNPQTIERVFEIYVWLLREKYIPGVERAFRGHNLSEHEFAAALSFHYNTGAIGRASWVKSFRAGNIATARQQIMNWASPPEIIPRRRKERDLFFDGKWSSDGRANVYGVTSRHTPHWRSRKRVDIRAELERAMA